MEFRNNIDRARNSLHPLSVIESIGAGVLVAVGAEVVKGNWSVSEGAFFITAPSVYVLVEKWRESRTQIEAQHTDETHEDETRIEP